MTTSAEEAGFLEAICAAPADDTPRLVYADWLDERGGPTDADRAWFIRTQCRPGYAPDWAEEAPRVAVAKGARATTELTAHESVGPAGYRLLGWDADGWVCYAPVEPDPHAPRVDVRFARGFASEVRCPARHWLERADTLFWHPTQTVDCPACVPDDEVRSHRPAIREGQRPDETTERLVELDPVRPRRGKVPRSACPMCSGTGRAPRPFQPTAQPLSRVRLTTVPQGYRTNVLGTVVYYFTVDGAAFRLISDAEVRAHKKRTGTGSTHPGVSDSAWHAPHAALEMLEAAWPVAFALPPEPVPGPPAGWDGGELLDTEIPWIDFDQEG